MVAVLFFFSLSHHSAQVELVCGDWTVLPFRAVRSQRLKLSHLRSSSRIVHNKLIEIMYKIHRLRLLTLLCGELSLMATPNCRRVWKILSLLLLSLRGNVCNYEGMKDRMNAWVIKQRGVPPFLGKHASALSLRMCLFFCLLCS